MNAIRAFTSFAFVSLGFTRMVAICRMAPATGRASASDTSIVSGFRLRKSPAAASIGLAKESLSWACVYAASFGVGRGRRCNSLPPRAR